jgi:hypothetical protein
LTDSLEAILLFSDNLQIRLLAKHGGDESPEWLVVFHDQHANLSIA